MKKNPANKFERNKIVIFRLLGVFELLTGLFYQENYKISSLSNFNYSDFYYLSFKILVPLAGIGFIFNTSRLRNKNIVLKRLAELMLLGSFIITILYSGFFLWLIFALLFCGGNCGSL